MQLPILQYHCIAEAGEGASFSRSTIPPAAFSRQVSWLAENGYEAITLATALTEELLPQKPVVLTFDDGYLDTFTNARPILAKHGWPATVFCIPGMSDTEAPIMAERWGALLMSHRQMRELADDGWEIGGHTLTHPRLPDLDTDNQRKEIVGGNERLQEITGNEVRTFAYPHGLHDASSRNVVEKAGMVGAVGVGKGNRVRRGDRYNLRRVFIRPDTLERKLAHRLGLLYDLFHRARQSMGLETC